MINTIYNKDVLRLASNITGVAPIEQVDASATHRSSLCGSSIEISISVRDKRITGYSQKIKACALGQASASVMAKAVIGKSKKEIQIARETVLEMLMEGTVRPSGDWAELSALAPARDAKSRHGAILLPFDALLKALD